MALVFTWAIEREWLTLHFAGGYARLPSDGDISIGVVFIGYPVTGKDRKSLPWAIRALAGPLHFWLVYEVISSTFPEFTQRLDPGCVCFFRNVAYLSG